MARLSEEKIKEIQELYATIGVYSRVAKMVGCSPATVKKYTTIATPKTDYVELEVEVPSVVMPEPIQDKIEIIITEELLSLTLFEEELLDQLFPKNKICKKKIK